MNRAGSRFFAGQAAEVRSFTSPLVSHGACIALIIAWVFRFVNRRGFFPLISHCRANRVDLNECLDVIGTVQSAEDEFFSKIIEADLQAVKKAMTERRLAALRSILNAKQYRRIWMYCAEEKSVTEIR